MEEANVHQATPQVPQTDNADDTTTTSLEQFPTLPVQPNPAPQTPIPHQNPNCSPPAIADQPRHNFRPFSFRDILSGPKSPPKRAQNLFAGKRMILQYEEDNPLMPCFTCSEDLKDELTKPWKHALFDKRVRELWKPRGEIEIMILGFSYYLIKFDNDEDRECVLLDGPWMV